MIPIIIIAAVLSTAIGGLFAIKFKDKLHLILGFGAGAIFGVAMFDLLPEAISLTSGFYSLQIVTALIAAGFCLFMLIDRAFSLHAHQEEGCENHSHTGKAGAVAIIIHSLLDGFSIGLGFKVSPAVGIVVALAVLIHGFSDGINTVNMVIKKNNKKSVVKWLLVDAIAPAVGVALAYFVTFPQPILGLVLATFVGIFLYISACDLMPESHHKHPAIWTTISTVTGIFVIYFASTLLG